MFKPMTNFRSVDLKPISKMLFAGLKTRVSFFTFACAEFVQIFEIDLVSFKKSR